MTKPEADADTGTPQRFLRRRAVQDQTGLPVSTLYFKISRGEFPRPIRLGVRGVAWPEAEVKAWMEARLAARDPKPARCSPTVDDDGQWWCPIAGSPSCEACPIRQSMRRPPKLQQGEPKALTRTRRRIAA